MQGKRKRRRYENFSSEKSFAEAIQLYTNFFDKKVDDKGVPGASKSLRLKSCDDARRLRTAVGECFEYASRPDVAKNHKERTKRATFLVVGGGPTGVELAGELFDLAEDITRPHKGTYPRLKGNIRVVLAHSGPELVPQFEEPLR